MHTQKGQNEVVIKNQPTKRKTILNLLRLYLYYESSASNYQAKNKARILESNLLRTTHSYSRPISSIEDTEEEIDCKINENDKAKAPRAGEIIKEKRENK